MGNHLEYPKVPKSLGSARKEEEWPCFYQGRDELRRRGFRSHLRNGGGGGSGGGGIAAAEGRGCSFLLLSSRPFFLSSPLPSLPRRALWGQLALGFDIYGHSFCFLVFFYCCSMQLYANFASSFRISCVSVHALDWGGSRVGVSRSFQVLFRAFRIGLR